MFKQILISDMYNILSDGWRPTSVPDHGFVSLFDIDWPDSVDITNHKVVDLHNPSSLKLVPFSSLMEEFLEEEDDARRMSSSIGDDGLVRMYYILLKDAIDSTIKVTYLPKYDGGGELFGEFLLIMEVSFFEKTRILLKRTSNNLQKHFDREIKEIPLDRCRLATPRKGSIVIVTRLLDDDSMILDERLMFTPPFEGTPPREDNFEKKMDGSCDTLHVRVDWSRGWNIIKDKDNKCCS
ncbi:hypothetical protein Tco_0997605 [Tanacetum coccineum]